MAAFDSSAFAAGTPRLVAPDALIRGRGRDQRMRRLGGDTWPAAYPIPIDARDFATMASLPGVEDGMNLVAKEFCVCTPERDIEGLADCLRRACEMPLRDKRERMAKLQRAISSEDVFWWVDRFVTDAVAMTAERHRPAA